MGSDIAPATSAKLPGIYDTSDATRILKTFVIEYYGATVTLDRLPVPAERKVLQERYLKLNTLLRPAHMAATDRDKTIKALSMLFAGYPSLRTANVKDMLEAYWTHLRDLPLFAICLACEDVAKGRIAGLDPDWPPSSPRLFDAAQRHVARLAIEKRQLNDVLGARKLLRAVVSPEEEARVKKKLRALSADLASQNNVTGDLSTPEEKASLTAAREKHRNQSILDEYRSLGIEPIYSGGAPVSVSLARQLGRIPPVRRESENQELGNGY